MITSDVGRMMSFSSSSSSPPRVTQATCGAKPSTCSFSFISRDSGMNSGKYAFTWPRVLEALVEQALDVLPDRVAVRPDDHAALDRRVVGQLGAADDVEIPARKIFGARRDFGDERFSSSARTKVTSALLSYPLGRPIRSHHPGVFAFAVPAARYTVVVGPGLLARASSVLAAEGLPATAALVTTSRIWRLHGRARITPGRLCGSDPHGGRRTGQASAIGRSASITRWRLGASIAPARLSRSAAAWLATWRDLRRPRSCAASTSFRFPPRCWRRSTAPSAAKSA